MSQKVVCNRCGAEAEIVGRTGKRSGWYMNVFFSVPIDHPTDQTIDLCPNCAVEYDALKAGSNKEMMAKIKSWLRGK